MQTGKNIGGSAKESAANVAATAQSGMEKTKATAQEKMEKMRAHDPLEKELAEERKDERMLQAELNKQQARADNAAHKQTPSATGHGLSGTGTGVGTDPHMGATRR